MNTKLFTLLALIASLWACADSTLDAAVRIVIDQSTTEPELAEIVERLHADHMNLIVEDAKYNSSGKLRSITGKVEYRDQGYSTFTTDNLGSIILTKDNLSDNSGFSVVVKQHWF